MDREYKQKSKRLRLECPVCQEIYTDSAKCKTGCPQCDENVCNLCRPTHLPICKSFKWKTELEEVKEVSKVLMGEMDNLVKRANDLHKDWQKDMKSGLQEVGVSLMSHQKIDRIDNISSINNWNATHEQIITKMKKLIKAASALRNVEFLRDTLKFKTVEKTIENMEGLGGLDSVSDTSVNSSSDSSSSDSGSSDNLSPDNFWPDNMALNNMRWDNIPSNNNRSSDSSWSDSSWSDSSSSDKLSSDNFWPENFWPDNMALNNMRWDNIPSNNKSIDSSSSDSSSSDSSSSDSSSSDSSSYDNIPSNNIWMGNMPPYNNSSSDSSSSSLSDGGLFDRIYANALIISGQRLHQGENQPSYTQL